MSRALFAPIALACTLLCATQAHADSLTTYGFTNGSESVAIAVTAPNVPTSLTADAGGITTSVNGGPSFTSYCVDLYQDVVFGQTYSGYSAVTAASHAFSNANAASDIARLFSENISVNDSVSQAAFQIAIWEIAYETSGAYNLSSGTAQFSGGTAATSGALTLASSWLSALPATSNVSLSVLESADNQDLVTAVPEPSTYALMIGGLIGMGAFARRRGTRRD